MVTYSVALLPGRDAYLASALTSAGACLTDDLSHADALVWLGDSGGFPTLPDTLRWVQLRTAGIESFTSAGLIDSARLWTNASGFYAENVAEHALALLLTGLRQIHTATRTRWAKDRIDQAVRSVRGATVGVIGAGGVGRALIPRLRVCGASVIAVNHSGRPVDGADATYPASRTGEIWAQCDHVVLAAPATPQTHHLVDADVLATLGSQAWVINVARGPLIHQAALIDALRSGVIAGAAIDVTDPEPPPPDDAIFDIPNLIVTPHVANPATGLTRELAPWVAENFRRFTADEELISVVTPGSPY